MVEHSTADREVPGSNPGAPSSDSFYWICYTKLDMLHQNDDINMMPKESKTRNLSFTISSLNFRRWGGGGGGGV